MDILTDNDFDLLIDPIQGDLVTGDGTQDDIALVVGLSQGALKRDALLGPNIIRLLKSNANNEVVERQIKLHLERDQKDFDDFKNLLKIEIL